MAQDEVIARRYARGLAEQANAQGRVDEVGRGLRLAAELLDPHAGEMYSPELANFLHSPIATREEKTAATTSIFEKLGLDETVRTFFAVLIRHNRVALLPRIVRCYAELSGALTGEYTAVVQTALPLTDDQAERLATALAGTLGSTVRVHQQITPGLLAGIRVTIGDKTFDGSVLGRLEALRHRLRRTGALDLEQLQAEETPS